MNHESTSTFSLFNIVLVCTEGCIQSHHTDSQFILGRHCQIGNTCAQSDFSYIRVPLRSERYNSILQSKNAVCAYLMHGRYFY